MDKVKQMIKSSYHRFCLLKKYVVNLFYSLVKKLTMIGKMSLRDKKIYLGNK